MDKKTALMHELLKRTATATAAMMRTRADELEAVARKLRADASTLEDEVNNAGKGDA